MAKGCVYILKTGKDAGQVFGSKESLAAHMNYTPALADMMSKYQNAGGKMDVDSVTKWLTDNGYLKAEGKAAKAEKPQTGKTSEKDGSRLSSFKKGDVVYRNYNGRYEEYTIEDTSKDVWKLVSPDGSKSDWNAANNEGFILKETKSEAKPTKEPTKKPAVKKEFPKAPVTDTVKAALKSVDNTTAAVMNLAKVLPTVYESIAKQVKLSIGKPASQQISEAYHNAVENGVEPELVAAVENAVALQEQMKSKPSLSGEIETNETLELQDVPTGTRAGNKASMDALERKHSDNATKKAVIAAVKKAARTLKSVFPSMDIHVHEDQKQYEAAMAGLNGQKNSKGNFVYSTSSDGTVVGRIDINLSTATPRTVVHEVTHAILLKTFGDNAPAFLDFRNKIEKIISDSGNKRLSEFADRYKEIADEVGQAEEYLTELSAILSDKETPLNYGIVRKIAELVNKAVSFVTLDKFQPFQDLQDQKDALEFFNTIAQSIKTGQEYSINDMGLHGEIKATGMKSKSSISSGEIKRFPVNQNTKVEEDVPLSRFDGKVANLMESDRMTGGYISDTKGNPIFKFYGGVFYPMITGKWWASRTESKARSIAENANKNRDKDGYVYSAPMVGSKNQHMSNADMLFATFELMKEDAKSKKSKVTKQDVIDSVNKAFNRKGIADKKFVLNAFSRAKNIADMFDELQFVMFQDGVTEYDKKGNAKLNTNILNRSGKPILDENEKPTSILSFEDRLAIVETLLGDPKVKEPRFPMAGSITDTAKRFAEPITEKAERIGDVVTIMRTKGTLKYKRTSVDDEFYHKSYPVEIYAVDENGNPAEIEVYVLDGAYSMEENFPELTQSSGAKFSYAGYIEKHKKPSVATAQYNRTAKLSSAAGKVVAPLKSKAQLVYDETGFISTDSMIEIVGANDPTYLGDVMNHILDMGEKLRSGNVGPTDLAKAYMMAVSSIRSGDLTISKFEDAIGKNVDEVFVEKERGKIRTEGAMAYLLTTPEGKRMLDNIGSGKIDAKDRAFIAKSMKPFGMFSEGESKFNNLFGNTEGKQINLTNINEFADMLKGGVQDQQQLFDGIAQLKGISQAKVGFVSNFLGIGTRGVIDAREIQGWMRGVVFKGELTAKEQAMQTELLKSLKNLTPLQKEILRRMKAVGDAFGVDPAISEYIGHHMIWDAVKNERTTHDGLYLAMKQNEDEFNNRLAEIKAKPGLKSKSQVDAYHGTGYEFDKFSAKKIGTGEGAQAFGWGLYFTDVKEIANEYAKKISFKNTVDNFLKEIGAEGATYRVWNEIISYMPEESKGEWLMEAIDQNYYDTFREEEVDQLRKFAEYKIKNNNKLPVSKNVYSVILHQGKTPDQYTWLEWDKQVDEKTINKIESKVPGFKQRFEGSKATGEGFFGGETPAIPLTGETVYKELSKVLGGDKEASMFLLENGVDGVKYPAESISRGTTSDTARGFNYVVFDENAVTIKMRSKAQLADNNAKEVADLYAQMREGGGWAERQKINAILDRDPKLSYIYSNFKEITRMLEDAQLLTKSGNCP
jgi:hypothetical protein